MSVASKNPFDLLGDDDDSSSLTPVPATNKPPATIQPKADNTPARSVPGSTGPRQPSSNRGGGGGGQGQNQSRRGQGQGQGQRGGYRNGSGGGGGDERPPRNTGPVPESGNLEGMENPGGFDGERVAPPKRAHHGPDKHTKPPGGIPVTSGGHRSRGAGHVRGARTPAFGGERRQFERRSGGNPDSQKKVDQGWGPNEGEAELNAEVEGEGDAVAEENTPQTPGAVDEDGGWGAPVISATEADAVAPSAEPEAPAEPEEVQKSYDEFLAERAQAALSSGLGKKEGRQVNAETLEGKAFRREAAEDVYFAGKEKTATKAKPKKEKVFIEVDGQFASPAGSRPTRGGERGGRGGGRGGRGFGGDRGGRGFGGDRGGRGRGAPRGGPGGYGGAGRGTGNADTAPITNDNKAFPALGA